MKLRDKIHKKIVSWPGVVEQPNQYGTKAAFFWNKKEFCHFHNDHEMDIFKTKVVPEKDTRICPNRYSSKWVLCNFNNPKDAQFAIKLCRAAYQEIKK